MNKNNKITAIQSDQLHLFSDWAASEGWNPGLNDIALYHAIDPNGFFVSEVEGEPVAILSTVKYSPTFGFLGFYIVKPEYRGQGYGLNIWQHSLQYLEGTCIGLDGVVEQQVNYQKSGFTLAYRNIRYRGTGGGAMDKHTNIVPLESLSFQTVSDYTNPFL